VKEKGGELIIESWLYDFDNGVIIGKAKL
jgi:hypothetical protein